MQKMMAWLQKPLDAKRETSGRPRLPSFGIPNVLVCHDGLLYTRLNPPLAPTMSKKFRPVELLQNVRGSENPKNSNPACDPHESSHVISGMYDFADSPGGLLPPRQ